MMSRWDRLRGLRAFLALLLLSQSLVLTGRADDSVTAVDNVRFEVAGELVYIYYDLMGLTETVHRVRVVLLRESDPVFLHRPVNVTGDIGTIVFPGDRRRITWDFTKEYPEGLTGNDYYFVVEAEPMVEKGMNPLIWVGGGAAVVGGILIFVLSGKGDEPPPPPSGFPAPVGRP